ncbi:AraC family transcriptional regulator [Maribacter antarcticus]|uniref:AraC family transcriptional regulator n=1 Tax=Maribacter antarcticus TaxID=505250 RepID=UPI00047E037C|nr:helix-turn-helix domain-containing protein [Maribacter antarcticus]
MRIFKFDSKKYGFELMMDLHRFETNPNLDFEPEPHTIDFYEIMFLEESKGVIELNDYKTKLRPMTILFASPHQKKRNNITNARGFHLVFKDDFLANFFSDKLFVHRLQYFYNATKPQYFQIAPSEYELIKRCLNEINTEIENYTSDSKHIIRSLLYFVLSKLNRLYSKQYGLSTDTQGNTEIYTFKEALENNIRSMHKVDAYASLLNVDRNKLNRILKSYNGLTAQQIIHHRLLQEIKTELLYTDQTISEIANTLNFSEANNLSRFFVKLADISPSDFRKAK